VADEAAVTLGDVDIALAWNVRGDAAQPAFVDATGSVLGLPLPLKPNTSARADGSALLWLGPRSWLYVVMGDAAHDDFDAARRTINAAGGALFDVSSSYVAWTIAGAASARVLNRGCPLDLHPAAFAPGRCAQSVFGHVNALLYRPDERSAFVVMVARSFAADAWTRLSECALTDGCIASPSRSSSLG
jgi:sarcosine oxidase subunit gamma